MTVTRTIDGVTETVASISVQALKDKDKNNSDAYAVISQARKPVTLYMGGEPLNFQNYFSSAKLWRFVDANTDESNFRTTFGYTGTNVFAATTSKDYTYSPDAPGGGSSKNQTKKTHNDFDVAIRAQRVGTGLLTILFGASDQHDPYHFAGYYDVEVRDVPVADGALTGSDLLLTGDKIGTIGVVGTMKGTNGEMVTGFFSWENPAEVAYEPGEKTFRATFTPHGDALSAFYDPVAVDVAVTVRLSIPAEPQPVELPPALELTYNGRKQTCRSGLGYMFVLGGVHEATAAGEYEATLTLSQGYYWADGTEGSKRFPWSIVPAKATISAVNARKPLGAVDPDFTATVSGLVDDFEPVYAVVRADHDETFGEHVLLATGETRQGNYTFAYENAVLEIYQVSASCTGDVMETTVGGDTVYTFRSGTCTMTLPDGVRADILVVGGGGLGESARKSVSSDYQGRGGGGGKAVYEMDVDLAADTYTIVVGEGGAASVAYTSSASGTYKTGSPGGESSIAGEGFQLTAAGGEAGAGTKSSVKGESSPGTGGANLSCPISGSPAVYGADGAAGGTMPAGEDAPASAANTGAGGHGGNSGAGGSGIVIVRLQNVIFPRTPVDPPAVATGLVFDNTVQVGVAAGAHYTRGGVHEATVAGEYEAIATPDDGFCWSDTGKHGPRAFGWSIARRPVTISVVSTNKIVGATFVDPDGRTFDDPIFTSTDNGLVASDTDIISWVIFRTNACEKVGAYDILIDGKAQQGNYDLTFVGGTYRILAASGPTVADGKGTIDYDPGTGVAVVTPNDGVREIEILGLPDGGTAKVPVTVDAVKGVAPDRLRIFAVAPAASGAAVYDITDAFAISGDAGTGVSIVLNDKAAVEIPSGDGAGETIPVSPVLTEPGDPAVEPFVIEGDAVAVGVKTIPGLTYGLKRGAEVSNLRAVGCGDVVDSRQAEGPRTKLVDSMEGDKPAKAFYVIEVKK